MKTVDATILVVCPTARDRLHFGRPEIQARYSLEFRGTDEATHVPGFDAAQFLDELLRDVRGRSDIRGVVGIDDFPACLLAALLAERLGLPSPSIESLFLCQHKFYSRLKQRDAAPEATPGFAALNLSSRLVPDDVRLPFPLFLKPVKSYLSILARTAETFTDVVRAQAEAPGRIGAVTKQFDALVTVSSLHAQYREVSASAFLLEEVLAGRQVTLDGYACNGRVVVLGVVDSVFYPGTRSFERFEYPSRQPNSVQMRMARIAERVVRHLGLDRTLFNIEFMYRPPDDSIWIVEINGRMASQFAPLYRLLDGIDLYAMQLDLALGRDVTAATATDRGRRPPRVAASFVLRRFRDGTVTRTPSPDDLARFHARFPDGVVEVLVREGQRLSDELQDDESFRYALVDLAANTWDELYHDFDVARALLPFAFTDPPSLEKSSASGLVKESARGSRVFRSDDARYAA